MPKLVRRRPILQRIKDYLNPVDFLLWLSEEIDSNGWDQLEKEWAIPIGVGLNLVFLVARANTGVRSRSYDDVFGDDSAGSGWLSWFASFVVHLLTLLSTLNAFYTFWRKRHYRLFESSVDTVPSTPSAHRVRIDSSPLSSSPLRFLASIITASSAESRAHPDAERDVWELAVWDPLPVCLRLFCYFSPGHVLVYWLFLPTLPSDPRPSTTIVTTIIIGVLLSFQLSSLTSSFSQQSKDAALIHKEVLNEYDTKYVHPRTQPVMRDVGTQFTEQASYNPTRDEKYNTVDTYRPAVVINRGFKTNPNPNYAKHLGQEARPPSSRLSSAEPVFTPAHQRDASSPVRPNTAIRQPQFRASLGPSGGDGGSLGVYSHAQSPLRKSASTNFDARGPAYTNDYTRDRTSMSPEKRPSSPLKRSSVPGGGFGALAAQQRFGHLRPSRRESGRF